MIKQLILIFLLVIGYKTITSQVDVIVNNLINFNDEAIKLSDSLIKFPTSNRSLKLPRNWKAKFKGELPSLYANSEGNYIIGHQSWDPYPKGALFNQIKLDTTMALSYIEFNYCNHQFLLTKIEEDKYKLHYHIDESEEFENHWMWAFTFKHKELENKNFLCELGYIIKQIVEEYDLKNHQTVTLKKIIEQRKQFYLFRLCLELIRLFESQNFEPTLLFHAQNIR